jgi:hypothetical protein
MRQSFRGKSMKLKKRYWKIIRIRHMLFMIVFYRRKMLMSGGRGKRS